MKKIIIVMMLSINAFSAENDNLYKIGDGSYSGWLVNSEGLTYSQNFDYDLAQLNVKDISAVVETGTTTFEEKEFTNGRYSTGYFTIESTISLRGVVISINGRNIYFGLTSDVSVSDYLIVPVGSNVNATADNLVSKINSDTTLSSIVIASSSSATVNLRSKYADATEYTLTTSNASKVSKSGAKMTGGVDAKVSASTDKITITNHGYYTGLDVLYTAGNDAIGGLSDQTTYYVIKIDDNNIKLATSKNNAISGTAINITSVVLDDSESTYTLTPLDLSGTPYISWEGSNDYSYWFSVSNSTRDIDSSNYDRWEFENYIYRYLRLKLVGPSTGAVKVKANLYIRK